MKKRRGARRKRRKLRYFRLKCLFLFVLGCIVAHTLWQFLLFMYIHDTGANSSPAESFLAMISYRADFGGDDAPPPNAAALELLSGVNVRSLLQQKKERAENKPETKPEMTLEEYKDWIRTRATFSHRVRERLISLYKANATARPVCVKKVEGFGCFPLDCADVPRFEALLESQNGTDPKREVLEMWKPYSGLVLRDKKLRGVKVSEPGRAASGTGCGVSRKYEFIYVHVLKGAGTSIKGFLEFGLCAAYKADNRPCPSKLWSTVNCNQAFQQFPAFFVFSFVRSPFARAFSLYSHALGKTRHRLKTLNASLAQARKGGGAGLAPHQARLQFKRNQFRAKSMRRAEAASRRLQAARKARPAAKAASVRMDPAEQLDMLRRQLGELENVETGFAAFLADPKFYCEVAKLSLNHLFSQLLYIFTGGSRFAPGTHRQDVKALMRGVHKSGVTRSEFGLRIAAAIRQDAKPDHYARTHRAHCPAVDWLGHLETMEADFDRLLQIIGSPELFEYLKENGEYWRVNSYGNDLKSKTLAAFEGDARPDLQILYGLASRQENSQDLVDVVNDWCDVDFLYFDFDMRLF